MKVERWPGGNFELEPGDMVRIVPQHVDHLTPYALGTVVVGHGQADRLVKIPSDAPPAMFLGEDTGARSALPLAHGRMAQVLHEGQIVNVPSLHVERVE